MAIDFSGKARQATDAETSVTTTSVTVHPAALALYVYVTQAGTFKVHADDTAITLPASAWFKVWDRGTAPLDATNVVTIVLGSAGNLDARQVV